MSGTDVAPAYAPLVLAVASAYAPATGCPLLTKDNVRPGSAGGGGAAHTDFRAQLSFLQSQVTAQGLGSRV
eukprot:213161-Rhodomonas_salina.1